jgi:nitroreductase
MDAYLAIVSRREVRRYAERPIPEDVTRQILDAGRLAGSSKNTQPWRFVVVESPEGRASVAEAVWAPGNIEGAALVVAVIVRGKGPVSFDGGRAAQNMMLAAHAFGVGACPNGVRDRDAIAAALGLEEEDKFATVLSFGYPARATDPESRTPEEWIERADRRPLDDVAERR